MATITDYVNEIQSAEQKQWDLQSYTLPCPTYSFSTGKKYTKIICTTLGSMSVHCFVDGEGNIYKAASWNVPAKGIRGNINNEKKPLIGYQFYGKKYNVHKSIIKIMKKLQIGLGEYLELGGKLENLDLSKTIVDNPNYKGKVISISISSFNSNGEPLYNVLFDNTLEVEFASFWIKTIVDFELSEKYSK